jgi:hypothetical protein
MYTTDMPLLPSKQKINVVDLFQLAMSDILASPEYFPSEEEMLSYYAFSKNQLAVIAEEQIKLSFVFLYLYAMHLVQSNLVKGYKSFSSDERRHDVSMAFGTAILSTSHIEGVKEVAHVSTSIDDWPLSIDNYTMYIVQNHEHHEYENDSFLAYKYFESQVVPDTKINDTPNELLLLAKHVRENAVQPLVKRILKKYNFVGP